MANPEHMEILEKGPKAWNAWIQTQPGIRVDLRNASLHGAKLGKADLIWADLRGADLSGANLTFADLIEANLSGADLRMTNLSAVDLRKADLSEANLRGANLRGADMSWANLRDAKLIEANLSQTNLSEVDLSGSDLSRAFLLGANVKGANLSRVTLSGADLSEAVVAWTVFAGVDLSGAKGLETVKHLGPSTVGIDTIHKSGGKIPDVFLRGAVVPDQFITYMGSLVGKPVEFYSCFISYSTGDEKFADRLYEDLQKRGVRCWFAPYDMAGGKKIHEQITTAIRLHDRLLLILSRASMRSKWVKTEIATARLREKNETRRVLFPVSLAPFKKIKQWKCFDAEIGEDSACEIREFHIPDFSCWEDPDLYQKAFDRLLRDLKTEPQRS